MEFPTGSALNVFDGAAARRWALAALRSLRTHRAAVDAINVFPVADRDTGSNMAVTFDSAVESLARVPEDADLPAVARALAAGALAGARGNSGVLLSQLLRGFADGLVAVPSAGAGELAAALARADDRAAAALREPAEGTMLTVLHAAAVAAMTAATAAPGGSGLAALAEAMTGAAADALTATTAQQPVLAGHGVVDAGGQGLLLVLEELAAVLCGRPARQVVAAVMTNPAAVSDGARSRAPGSGEGGQPPPPGGGYQYEVMYQLDTSGRPGGDAAMLRQALAAVGDCVSVVTDGDRRWAVHVHCDDIGAAIEAGIAAGRPHRITVERFADQRPRPQFDAPHAVVALVRGDRLAELFRAEGATVLELGEDEVPTAAGVLAAIGATRAAAVTVLTNEPEFADACAAAAGRAGDHDQVAVVVPAASPVQGIAALAVHDPARRAVDDEVAMAEAAAATRRGALLVAEQEALTWVGRCRPGDLLGMVDGEVAFIEPDPANTVTAACRLLVEMLAPGGELVTALIGADAPPGLVERLRAHLHETRPEVEFTDYHSGRHDALLLLGVE